MFFAPTTADGGLTFGFAEPVLGNVHLTIYSRKARDGKWQIHSHLTDHSDGHRTHPWTQVVDAEFLNQLRTKMTRRWKVPVEQLRWCYVPTPYLQRRLAKWAPKPLDPRTLEVPLEGLYGGVRADFSSAKRWRKLRTTRLAGVAPGFGLARHRGQVRWVFGIRGDPGHVVAISNLQATRVMNRVLRLIGFEMLTEYLDYRGFKLELEPTRSSVHPGEVPMVRRAALVSQNNRAPEDGPPSRPTSDAPFMSSG